VGREFQRRAAGQADDAVLGRDIGEALSRLGRDVHDCPTAAGLGGGARESLAGVKRPFEVYRHVAAPELGRGVDVVWFEPGEKHWHGAAPTVGMSHIAVVETKDGHAADWMEPSPTRSSRPRPRTSPSTRA